MKRILIIAFVLFGWSVFSANAQDLIVLRDGNVIEAKVTEITPTEIKYKRFNNLNGPVIVISKTDVLSIRYENKTTEVINQSPSQPGMPASLQSGAPTLLQQTLNRLPAIPIAGNNLKFEFHGDTWTAKVNGENFSAGTIEYEANEKGGILTLKQTHIWPGAVGKTAGKVAGVIPGGSAASGALNTAGTVTGAAGPIEMSGTVILLDYNEGPPASLKLISISQDKKAKKEKTDTPTEKSANARNNWMSAELAISFPVSIGIRYERMLNSYISIGANFYYGGPPLSVDGWYNYLEVNAFFRAYPWGKAFFLGVGLGYFHGWDKYPSIFDGIIFVPEMGWKIDIGKPGGFYIMPCLTFPVVFIDDEFLVSGTRGMGGRVLFYLGMGIAF